MLHMAEPFLAQNLHPTVIVRGAQRPLSGFLASLFAHRSQQHTPIFLLHNHAGYVKALEDALAVIDTIAFPIDTNNRAFRAAAFARSSRRPGSLTPRARRVDA